MQNDRVSTTEFGIIILAAGGSSRLGRPKQLLLYSGKPLLQHLVQVASATSASKVIVVLGAHEEQIRNAVELHGVQIVTNHNWQEGMASSVRSGINALVETCPQIQAVILMLCDQPYVTTALLNSLAAVHSGTGKKIVASGYNHIPGPPALFHCSIFSELLQLKGDVGARAIIQQHMPDVEMVAFSKGSVDIDTEEDCRNL